MNRLALVGMAGVLGCMSTVCAAFADPVETKDASPAATKHGAVVEEAPPFPIAGKYSHLVQKWTGINWLTGKSLSTGASVLLSARTLSFVDARVQPYNFTDLFTGKFRSAAVHTHGGKYGGIPLGNVDVEVSRPFQLQYFKHGKRRAGLKTPILVNLHGALSESDFAAGLRSKRVSSGLRFLKLDLPGLGEQRLQVLHPQVDLQNGKVQIDTLLLTAGAAKETGVNIRILAAPALDKERYIVLKDMQVSSADIPNPKEFSQFVEELFNPLVDFGRMDRQSHAFRLTKLEVTPERVSFDGRLVLAPKPTPAGSEKK